MDAYWELMESGNSAITEGRQDGGNWVGTVGDPDAKAVEARFGAFVEGIDRFDSRFFRISPLEAKLMDPQQRMLLETTWQAVEDAGIPPDSLRGSRTGVYAGVSASEYRSLTETRNIEPSYLGTTTSVATGRIAFALGLEGPAMPVDMACASALAAVHQAVNALHNGEVELALAGGVNVVLSPSVSSYMKELGMLSPTGKCSPFDASANGYVRGEGCGMVALKRLSDAEAAGDRIWAVIKGTAINQNGASAGLTVPNGTAQEHVMEDALAQADVAPSDVDYLEAHATGFHMADPIELNAAASVYGEGRASDRPLLVGSVKSILGHLEWAAGIAALIKAVLSMNRGKIPLLPRFTDPNPAVAWDEIPLQIVAESTAWPTDNGKKPLASVNAFGISGTNANVLVEGYGVPSSDLTSVDRNARPSGAPQPVPIELHESIEFASDSQLKESERTARLLPLSGKSESAVRELAERYLSWLDDSDEASVAMLSDMAWTASVGRSHFPYRASVVFNDAEQLRRKLVVIADASGPAIRENTSEVARIAFSYSRTGIDWSEMGKALYQSEPVARAVLDRCDELAQAERSVSLLDIMFGRGNNEQDTEDPRWSATASFAIQCALTALGASVGIRPDVVLASGTGAVAAACAIEALSLEDGLQLALALDALEQSYSEEQKQAVRDRITAALAGNDRTGPSTTLVSSVTGRAVDPADAFDLDRLLQEDSRLPALNGWADTLVRLGVNAILDVSSDPSVLQRVIEAWPATTDKPAVLATGGGFVAAAAAAYEAGLEISLQGLFAGESRQRISIPTYPFQRRRHWVDVQRSPTATDGS
jgi:acyl transferase domain-containing protein